MPDVLHYSAHPVPEADREVYLRENAVAVVREKDAKIGRLRKRIHLLEKSNRSRKLEIQNLQDKLLSAAERIAKQSDLLSKKAEK